MIIGIVGKPSCGKSTFFKAATLANVEIANYPFTTIKPNHAMGYVKINDAAQEFQKKANPREGYVLGSYRFVPIDLLDVAGLVPGAHEGLGMGNQFLDDLRQADALVHVIDISGSVNEKGEPVPPLSYNPANDVVFLEEELDMWIVSIIKKGWDKFARTIQQEKSDINKALAKQLSGLRVTEEIITNATKKLQLNIETPSSWTDAELKALAKELRIKTKPMLIAANKIDVPGAEKNLRQLQEKFPHYTIIPCSAESELALREASRQDLIDYIPGNPNFVIKHPEKLSEKQQKALQFLKQSILEKYQNTGIQQVLDYAVFNLLNYIALHPGGVNKLEDKNGNCIPDCFLMPANTTALQFAFRLHTDFGNKFICAKDCRTKMTVGRDYKLKHLDIIEIVAGK